MTALNQALIKAFAQQDKGVALPPDPGSPKTGSPPPGNRRQPAAAGSPESQGNHREPRGACEDFCARTIQAQPKGDSPIFGDAKIGTVPPKAAGLPLADAFGVELATFDKTPPRPPLEHPFPDAQRTFSALHPVDAVNNAQEAALAPVFETPV